MSSVMDLSRFEEYYNLMQSMCLGYEQMQTTRMLEFFYVLNVQKQVG